MLLMIEELDDEMNHGSGKCRERNIPKDSLPCARYKIGHQSHGKTTNVGDERFPRIHKREPDDFHSAKVSLSMNHVAVPSW